MKSSGRERSGRRMAFRGRAGGSSSRARNRPVVIFIPSLLFGGAERVAVQLASFLSRKRSVCILAMEKGLDFEVPSSVEYVCLSSLNGRASSFLKILFFPIHLFRAWRFFRNRTDAVTISFMMRTSLIAALLRLPRLVFSLHTHISTFFSTHSAGFFSSVLRNFSYRFLLTSLKDRAVLTTVPSRSCVVDLVENFGFDRKAARAVYNPVEIENISSLASEKVPSFMRGLFNGFVVAYHSRLVDLKGHANLLRIFKLVKEKVPKARLLIVGDGELRQFLLDFSSRLGLKAVFLPGWKSPSLPVADVFFAGFQKNPFKFLARSDLFVFPSLWEGFPVALIEAATLGLPLIAADCKSGPRELVAPGSDIRSVVRNPFFADFGVLMPPLLSCRVSPSAPSVVPCQEEEVWAGVIIDFLRDGALRRRFSSLSKRRAKAFSYDSVMRDWDSVVDFASRR